MVSLKGCKLLEDDISVLRHWGDCMKKAKVGELKTGDIKSNNCMWCQKYNTLTTMEIGKPGDPCTLDCPIRFYTGKSGCAGSPWHDVAHGLTNYEGLKPQLVSIVLEIADAEGKEMIQGGLKIKKIALELAERKIKAQIYRETKRMFLFIVEAIRFKRMTPEERTRLLSLRTRNVKSIYEEV